MKKAMAIRLAAILLASALAGCYGSTPSAEIDGVLIQLSDEQTMVNGSAASSDPTQAVYTANDIIYYESGRDFTYGEGKETDAHSKEEADAHTVVHITKPGRYILSGQMTKGQVAVDLGKDADDDPNAVVTLVLDGVDITCEVAPAIIFYNVYECGDKDVSSPYIDTSRAGANVEIADGTVNNVTGAYVAKIYKPESVELNKDGTEVKDAKKLHKYDAAFYSKMSMNVHGNTGVLNINAANEGLDTEMHLSINGGHINIRSGNDGINTNEDGVSVAAIHGGTVNIRVDGSTGEGDGIDSNGYLVIDGGTVIAQACSFSMDAGIDSDLGIYLNGGTVVATGNMLDHIGQSGQNYAVFQFADKKQSEEVVLKNAEEQTVVQEKLENEFSILVISAPEMKEGEYTLWLDGVQQEMAGQGMDGMKPPQEMGRPEGMEPPEDMPQKPEGMQPPPKPEGMEGMQPPEGQGFGNPSMGSVKDTFSITEGGSYFQVIA